MGSVIAWMAGGILFVVGGFHLYWMSGGRLGALAALPTNGLELLFRPSKAATGLVAVALLAAGWFVLELGRTVERIVFPDWLYAYGGWALAAVFLIRTIGDFRWVGLFKKQRGTLFAKWDTVLYSPLCLFLGVCLLYMTIIS